MKKRVISFILLTALLTTAFSLAGCSQASKTDDKTIKVGASPAPHAEILAQVKDVLADEGYTLEIVEYNDYVLPNTALDSGELDANYFQHQPYLDDFNAENGTDIVSAGSIHFEPFGIYAGKTASIADLAEGATIAVPNDATNEARALLLLEAQGLIKLKENVGLSATKLDIAENPLNLNIEEIEAAQIVRSLADVDLATINGNYAIDGGLSVSDALASEDSASLAATTYANIVAVQAGHENDEKIKALIGALQSDAVRQFIEEEYKGAVVPVF
ncbi:MetQ/NlpA family ABC transporter substrate-binding protein [Konateibacter massiliensis]|uniref:MetQ/NlpA family ABC transporter substrate-binding protein n=1 Tax=Konateibacter massiliensis TaxID=2002841 RepID=UPI000C157295|nr:MetQ/NlpA family ABC transporter substrate-binding protein [Konateibacter massiliensis]